VPCGRRSGYELILFIYILLLLFILPFSASRKCALFCVWLPSLDEQT